MLILLLVSGNNYCRINLLIYYLFTEDADGDLLKRADCWCPDLLIIFKIIIDSEKNWCRISRVYIKDHENGVVTTAEGGVVSYN